MSHVHKFNTVKISIALKAIYRLNTNPIKISMTFFTKLAEKNHKMHIESQKTLSSQNNLEKKKKK